MKEFFVYFFSDSEYFAKYFMHVFMALLITVIFLTFMTAVVVGFFV